MSEKYNCLECGKCCRVFLIFENLTNEEIEYYKLRFGDETFKQLKGNTYAYIKNCFNLIGVNSCLIYKKRPTFCRKFKVGSKYCELCRLLSD